MFRFFILSLFVCAASYAEIKVYYLTDLEGSRKRLEAFFAKSGAVRQAAQDRWEILPGNQIVYGGDVPDRYYGSLWVTHQLLQLKKAQPDQMTLILGNRDVNKLRIPLEISEAGLAGLAPVFSWIRVGEWLNENWRRTPVERLKYILRRTMGAPNGFELRRRELQEDPPGWARGLWGANFKVTDELVVESYLHELGPKGEFSELLSLGKLAHRIGPTLFVHGGITAQNFGLLPGADDRFEKVEPWILALNQWLYEQMGQWKKEAYHWDGQGERPADALIRYPMPEPGSKENPFSVIYARNVDSENMPLLPPHEIIALLKAQGIYRIAIGHTPTGDAPVVLRLEDDSFEVVSADNSYADESIANVVVFSGVQTRISSQFRGLNGLEPISTVMELGQASPFGRYHDGWVTLGQNSQEELIEFRMQQFQTQYRVRKDCARKLTD